MNDTRSPTVIVTSRGFGPVDSSITVEITVPLPLSGDVGIREPHDAASHDARIAATLAARQMFAGIATW
jgi:hypothetical protein